VADRLGPNVVGLEGSGGRHPVAVGHSRPSGACGHSGKVVATKTATTKRKT
jgi:hypothetical protein